MCKQRGAEVGAIWLAIGDRARLGLWSPGCKEYGDRGGRHVHFALSARPGGLTALRVRLDAAGKEVEGPIPSARGGRRVSGQIPSVRGGGL
jgi:hypothetical protein